MCPPRHSGNGATIFEGQAFEAQDVEDTLGQPYFMPLFHITTSDEVPSVQDLLPLRVGDACITEGRCTYEEGRTIGDCKMHYTKVAEFLPVFTMRRVLCRGRRSRAFRRWTEKGHARRWSGLGL